MALCGASGSLDWVGFAVEPGLRATNGVVLAPDDFGVATDVRRVTVFAEDVAAAGTVVTPGGSVVTPVDPGGTVIG